MEIQCLDLQTVISLVGAAGKFLYRVLATHPGRHSQFVADGAPKGTVSKMVMAKHLKLESLFKEQDKHFC